MQKILYGPEQSVPPSQTPRPQSQSREWIGFVLIVIATVIVAYLMIARPSLFDFSPEWSPPSFEQEQTTDTGIRPATSDTNDSRVAPSGNDYITSGCIPPGGGNVSC